MTEERAGLLRKLASIDHERELLLKKIGPWGCELAPEPKFPARVVLGEGWPQVLMPDYPTFRGVYVVDKRGHALMNQLDDEDLPRGKNCPRYRLVLERIP
jgi:hypothetical protein